jgi:hypothetical protein
VSEQARAADALESSVIEIWRKGHLSCRAIVNYLYWVRRFRKHCEKQKLVESEQLTNAGLQRFLAAYAGPRLMGRQSAQSSRTLARNAVHAWACALRALGRHCHHGRKRGDHVFLPFSMSTVSTDEPTTAFRKAPSFVTSEQRGASSTSCGRIRSQLHR